MANAKSVAIDNKVDAGTYAMADVHMISIVLHNLISNAIKFSKNNGSVKVYVQQFDQYSKVFIEDEGIGLDEKVIEHLFSVAYDHKTIGNSQEKGTGIGLILCKEFITRHRGDIGVESKINKGSTFFFTLPKN